MPGTLWPRAPLLQLAIDLIHLDNLGNPNVGSFNRSGHLAPCCLGNSANPIFSAAPFEPNQGWLTLITLVRWVGSPISSLTSVLWNIDLTAKCALLVDLSSRYNIVPREGSYFWDMRNALLILSMMVQYTLSSELDAGDAIPVERLIRSALFGHFEVPDSENPGQMVSTSSLRARLAHAILIRRRRGVVPNILTYLWFLFSIAISIQACE